MSDASDRFRDGSRRTVSPPPDGDDLHDVREPGALFAPGGQQERDGGRQRRPQYWNQEPHPPGHARGQLQELARPAPESGRRQPEEPAEGGAREAPQGAHQADRGEEQRVLVLGEERPELPGEDTRGQGQDPEERVLAGQDPVARHARMVAILSFCRPAVQPGGSLPRRSLPRGDRRRRQGLAALQILERERTSRTEPAQRAAPLFAHERVSVEEE
jgi:hypothetical protein